MNIYLLDITLLILFCIFVFVFIYKNKGRMKREGLMYLYKTQVGVKFMDRISRRYSKILNFSKYIIIATGYLLMIVMLYLFSSSFWQYITNAKIFEAIKAPPIAPLIPYFPKLFGMQSYFPDFYFVDFIVAISIVAIVHEFSHGIFMQLFKIRIKSTGFAFLGPILGAFVEQDEKQMEKKPKIQQMTVLSAGVFANLVTGIIFFIIMVLFFFAAYHPAGYIFNTYSLTAINKTDIKSIQEINGNLTEIIADKAYYLDNELKLQLSPDFKENLSYLFVYEGPAVKAQLSGAIIEMNGQKIQSKEDLQSFMATTKPGDKVLVKTKENGIVKENLLVLEKNPNSNIGYLGVGSYYPNTKSIFGKIFLIVTKFKDPNILYEANFNFGITDFIYYLFWWIVIINMLVALFNMLPLGILDGGKFFYLTIFGITRSEKIAKKSFKFITWLLLGMLIFMLLWYFRRFL